MINKITIRISFPATIGLILYISYLLKVCSYEFMVITLLLLILWEATVKE